VQLLTLQLGVDRPHLGRLEVAARVGKPDISAHVMQVVREMRPDAEVPGFRKGRAPLKRVKEHFIKDVRARARARLVELRRAARASVAHASMARATRLCT
jgi:trigger factor